jgi:NAD(P)H-dependent FMN reductase
MTIMRDYGILVVAGSNRAASLNRRLAYSAAALAREAGHAVAHLDLRDYPLPLYDGDLESEGGVPSLLASLRELFKCHPIWLIASPDYNSSVSPLLKNVIDWISRPVGAEDYLACFKDKRVGIMASSPGTSGGARGLPHLRQILAHLGASVGESHFVVPRGLDAFDQYGMLREAARRLELREFIARIAAREVATCAA